MNPAYFLCFFSLILQSLTRLLASRKEPQLKTSAILAFSNLLHIACVDTREREARYFTLTFHEVCQPENIETYLSWFLSGAKSDLTHHRVFLTALGKTADLRALADLRSFALDVSVSTYIRTVAVYSIKYHVLIHPREASTVLFSLYRNVGLPVPVRTAAVSLLFYTKPTLTAFQRIAVSTWYEPIPAVAGFVRNSLQSLSSINDPVYQSM